MGTLGQAAVDLKIPELQSRVLLRESPARFDASTHVVEQHSVASTDGTEIPYFLVRPRDQANDGSVGMTCAPLLALAFTLNELD